MIRLVPIAGLVIALLSATASAQPQPVDEIQALKDEIAALKAELAKLRADIAQLKDAIRGGAANPQPPAIPDWVLKVPNEPGKAYYGVGVGSFMNPAMMQLGVNAADQNARNQIAATIQNHVALVLRAYLRSVPEQPGTAESLRETLAQTVVQATLHGCEIVKRSIVPGENNLKTVYALARLSFDNALQTLKDELAKVQRGAPDVNELRQLLEREHAKAGNNPADEKAVEPKASFPEPDWFKHVPNEIGCAFYGVGMGTCDTPSTPLEPILDVADRKAREAIAARVQSLTEPFVKAYLGDILAPADHAKIPELTASLSQLVKQSVMQGCTIIKRELRRDNRADPNSHVAVAFSLARITFDDVIDHLHAEMSKEVRRVAPSAKIARDDIHSRMKKQHETLGNHQPPK